MIYYDNTFIDSISEFFKKMTLSSTLDQELLDSLAIIVNYLAQEKDYEYLQGTAKIKDHMLTFSVTKDTEQYVISLALKDDYEISYKKVASS